MDTKERLNFLLPYLQSIIGLKDHEEKAIKIANEIDKLLGIK